MSGPGPEEPADGPVEALLRTFLSDSLLWPVLAVALLVLGTLGGAVILIAFEDRQVWALAGLAALLGMTLFGLEGDLRRRRLGPIGIVLVALWLLSGLFALGLSWLTPHA